MNLRLGSAWGLPDKSGVPVQRLNMRFRIAIGKSFTGLYRFLPASGESRGRGGTRPYRLEVGLGKRKKAQSLSPAHVVRRKVLNQALINLRRR